MELNELYSAWTHTKSEVVSAARAMVDGVPGALELMNAMLAAESKARTAFETAARAVWQSEAAQ